MTFKLKLPKMKFPKLKRLKLDRRKKMFLFGSILALLLVVATSLLLSGPVDPIDMKYRVRVSVNRSIDSTITGVVSCMDTSTGDFFNLIYSDTNDISGDTFRFLSFDTYIANETAIVLVQIGRIPEEVYSWTYDIPIWNVLNDVPSSMFEIFPEKGVHILCEVVEA